MAFLFLKLRLFTSPYRLPQTFQCIKRNSCSSCSVVQYVLPWLPNVLAHLHHFLNLFLSLLLASLFTTGDWSALLCSLRRESVAQHIRWETLSSVCRCCADGSHKGAIGEECVRTAPANLGVELWKRPAAVFLR